MDNIAGAFLVPVIYFIGWNIWFYFYKKSQTKKAVAECEAKIEEGDRRHQDRMNMIHAEHQVNMVAIDRMSRGVYDES